MALKMVTIFALILGSKAFAECQTYATDYAGNRPLIARLRHIGSHTNFGNSDYRDFQEKLTCKIGGANVDASILTPYDQKACTVKTELYVPSGTSVQILSADETSPGQIALQTSAGPVNCEARMLPVDPSYISRANSLAKSLLQLNSDAETEVAVTVVAAFSQLTPSGAVDTQVFVEKKYKTNNDANGVRYQQYQLTWEKWPKDGPKYFFMKALNDTGYPTIE